MELRFGLWRDNWRLLLSLPAVRVFPPFAFVPVNGNYQLAEPVLGNCPNRTWKRGNALPRKRCGDPYSIRLRILNVEAKNSGKERDWSSHWSIQLTVGHLYSIVMLFRLFSWFSSIIEVESPCRPWRSDELGSMDFFFQHMGIVQMLHAWHVAKTLMDGDFCLIGCSLRNELAGLSGWHGMLGLTASSVIVRKKKRRH